MIDFGENLFSEKSFNAKNAFAYGFTESKGGFVYSTEIMNGQFSLDVFVSDGKVTTKITDKDTGEEYTLYRVDSASGAFVGRVRTEVGAVLKDIAERCFDGGYFKRDMTKEVTDFVLNKYGDSLEFLWADSLDNAVLRRKDTGKWYAVFIYVSRVKLGLSGDEKVETIGLKLKPEEVVAVTDGNRILPAYHMNKKHWVTIVLDGSVPLGEIAELLDKSYSLAVK